MKASLCERLAALGQQGPGSALGQETLEQVFRGVDLVTGLSCPTRRLERLKSYYQLPDGAWYGRTLLQARKDMDTLDWQEEGEQLMARLLIEPFAAIHEMWKEENDDDCV